MCNVVHLCITYRQLVMAICDTYSNEENLIKRNTSIICLIDFQFIPIDIRYNLIKNFNDIKFYFLRESSIINEFSILPHFFPSIIRRNITFRKHNPIIYPHQWKPKVLNGLSFETGYVYHSGPFLSKVFRGICNTLILREDGLSNYIPHNVSLSKGIIRALFGLSYRDQVWGEEKWIHMIEVERPVDLPQRVRHKAREYSFGNLLHHTSTETKNLLKKTFLLDVLDLNKNKKTCIILTQPVDDDKYCSTELKMELYNIIAKKFLDRDYLVYLKQHPKEKAYSIPVTLFFPI